MYEILFLILFIVLSFTNIFLVYKTKVFHLENRDDFFYDIYLVIIGKLSSLPPMPKWKKTIVITNLVLSYFFLISALVIFLKNFIKT